MVNHWFAAALSGVKSCNVISSPSTWALGPEVSTVRIFETIRTCSSTRCDGHLSATKRISSKGMECIGISLGGGEMNLS